MLKKIFYGLCLLVFTVACKKDEEIMEIHTVNEADYPLVDTIAGVNIDFMGQRLRIAEFQDNIWFTKTEKVTYPWVSSNQGKINFVSNRAILKTETQINGKYSLYEITLQLPNIYIEDLENPKNSYNYANFLAMFHKGRYDITHTFPSYTISPTGKYQLRIWSSEYKKDEIDTSFHASSLTTQKGSYFELIDVKELGFNEILVKYKVNFNMSDGKKESIGRLKGVMQFRVRFQEL